MRNIDKLKKFLKETAAEIRITRHQYKEAQRGKTTEWGLLGKLLKLQREYRHHHIAYCELRGRTREQIERPRDNHMPNESYIDDIKELYAWSEEDIATYNERTARRKANAA